MRVSKVGEWTVSNLQRSDLDSRPIRGTQGKQELKPALLHMLDKIACVIADQEDRGVSTP